MSALPPAPPKKYAPAPIMARLTAAAGIAGDDGALAAPAVGASLLAYIVIYTIVFGIGVYYILRLMADPPKLGEEGLAEGDGPIRTSGITPAPQVARAGTQDPKPAE